MNLGLSLGRRSPFSLLYSGQPVQRKQEVFNVPSISLAYRFFLDNWPSMKSCKGSRTKSHMKRASFVKRVCWVMNRPRSNMHFSLRRALSDGAPAVSPSSFRLPAIGSAVCRQTDGRTDARPPAAPTGGTPSFFASVCGKSAYFYEAWLWSKTFLWSKIFKIWLCICASHEAKLLHANFQKVLKFNFCFGFY